ncbi:MAG: hypothetical protein KGQ83_08735 [Planctomycetes bacterium]|nr:hypothetical protein [Planctomycetota bacterium]
MGIDKLCLTTYAIVKTEYLREFWKVSEDEYRLRLYKYFCEMDYAQVMWRPHKFGDDANSRIPYSKVDVNPKYFGSFQYLYDYLENIFGERVDLDYLHVSRIDLTADIENLPIDVVLARLHVSGFNRTSFSIYKGSTIYIGSDPKIRIYDKTKEIKYRLRKGCSLTAWEKGVVESEKQITRIELQLGHYDGNLKNVVDDPVSLVSHFDRLRFYNFEDDEKIASVGGLQMLMSKINRKFRGELNKFRASELETMVKHNYIDSVKEWFEKEKDAALEEIPF